MSDDASTRAVASGRRETIVGDGSVEVVISFAPIVMSAAEAEAFCTGHLLEIGARLEQAVLSVQVSGRKVATGRLVALIDDHAGVALTHVRS